MAPCGKAGASDKCDAPTSPPLWKPAPWFLAPGTQTVPAVTRESRDSVCACVVGAGLQLDAVIAARRVAGLSSLQHHCPEPEEDEEACKRREKWVSTHWAGRMQRAGQWTRVAYIKPSLVPVCLPGKASTLPECAHTLHANPITAVTIKARVSLTTHQMN